LRHKEKLIRETADEVMKNFPKSSYSLVVKEQYRNMKSVLDKNPQVVDYAIEAIKRSGITPHCSSIRGGTDGSRLSFMGLLVRIFLPANTRFIRDRNGCCSGHGKKRLK